MCYSHLIIHRMKSISLMLTVCLSLSTATAFLQTRQTKPLAFASPDSVIIEQDTKEILKRPEFRHLTRNRQVTSDSPLDFEDLLDEEPETINPPNIPLAQFAGSVIMALSYIGIVAVCCLIIFLLYRSLAGFQLSSKTKDLTNPGQQQGEITLEEIISPAENESSIYVQRAKELAQTGDYHNAIIQLLYGSMSFIERSGWIRFRKGLTYRDYLRATRPHGLPCDSFRQMIRTYEPLGFGRREATREHFESTLGHYEAAFQKKT